MEKENQMHRKALFFDLDNTLINRDEAMKQFIIDLLSPISKEELEFIMQKDNSGYTKRMDFAKWFVENHPVNGFDAKAFFDFQIERIGDYVSEAPKEIMGLLDWCQEHFNLFLLSNGGLRNQTKKLEQAKLTNYFPLDRRIISGAVGFHKPDKRIFELLLNKFKIKPNEILMIGDDVINDIEGASKIGLMTCWVANGREFPSNQILPNYIVKNLLDTNFKKQLQEWKAL